jgi:hypothetical protein
MILLHLAIHPPSSPLSCLSNPAIVLSAKAINDTPRSFLVTRLPAAATESYHLSSAATVTSHQRCPSRRPPPKP